MKIDMRILRNLVREELVKDSFNSILSEAPKMSNQEQTSLFKEKAAEMSKLVKDKHAPNFMTIVGALADASANDPAKWKMAVTKVSAALGISLEEVPEDEEGGEGSDGSSEEEKAEQMKKLEA